MKNKENLTISEINYKAENIFWDSVTKIFNIEKETLSDVKRKMERSSFPFSSIYPEQLVKSDYKVSGVYALICPDKKSDKKLYESKRDLFYETFKDLIIQDLGARNYTSFLSSALKNKKNYDKYSSDSNHNNFFHETSINDERVRSGYAKGLLSAAMSVDASRGDYGTFAKCTILALKTIKDDSPDLFDDIKKYFLNTKHMSDEKNQIAFMGAFTAEDLLKEDSSIKDFVHNFSELKDVLSSDGDSLFEDVNMHYLKLNVKTIMKLTGSSLSGAADMTNRIVKSLKECFPEYQFDGQSINVKGVNGSFDESKIEFIYFAFDSRLCSEVAMKKVLPDFIKNVDAEPSAPFKITSSAIIDFVSKLNIVDRKINLEKMINKTGIQHNSNSSVDDTFKM